MNISKYLLVAALLAGGSMAAVAQDGSPADIEAAKTLVKNKPADFDKQVKAFAKANKKNAEQLVAIGRVFYEAEDTANARFFAQQALTASKRNSPGAYVLLGDIAAKGDNGGEAAQNYEQAILADAKNVEAYRKYASVYRKISPEGAVAKLEELRQNVPGYPVDALIGHISYLSLRYATAIEAYSKVQPITQLDRMGFIEFAMSNYHARQYEEALRIVKSGLDKFSGNATLNRLAMMCNNELKNYPDALQYAETLFTKIDKDSVTLSDIDYQNYGNALAGNERYEEAIAKFREAINLPTEDKSLHADLFKSISDSYKSMKQFPEAIEAYNQFLSANADADATDHAGLAMLIANYGRTLEGDERIATIKQADEAYADLITKFPDAEEFALWQRGRLNSTIDPDMSLGLSKPHFERMIELITAHEELDETDNKRLEDGYRYMMSYNYQVLKDSKAALEWAKKILEVKPDDAGIQTVVETLSKTVK